MQGIFSFKTLTRLSN